MGHDPGTPLLGEWPSGAAQAADDGDGEISDWDLLPDAAPSHGAP
jgi:hypothetical protein